VSAAEVVEPEAFRQVREVQQGAPAAVFLEATDDRDELLRRVTLGTRLPEGRRLVEVVERGTDEDAEFDLRLEDGTRFGVGKASAVADPRKLDTVFASRAKHELPYYTPKEWRPFAFAIMRAAVPDGTSGGKVEEAREWLAGFGEQERSLAEPEGSGKPGLLVVDLDDKEQLWRVLYHDKPSMFLGSDQRAYVRVPHLFRYINRLWGQHPTSQDLKRRLARLGFRPPNNKEGKLAARAPEDGAFSSRRYLASEPGFEV
jgi:hypothetical protein